MRQAQGRSQLSLWHPMNRGKLWSRTELTWVWCAAGKGTSHVIVLSTRAHGPAAGRLQALGHSNTGRPATQKPESGASIPGALGPAACLRVVIFSDVI